VQHLHARPFHAFVREERASPSKLHFKALEFLSVSIFHLSDLYDYFVSKINKVVPGSPSFPQVTAFLCIDMSFFSTDNVLANAASYCDLPQKRF